MTIAIRPEAVEAPQTEASAPPLPDARDWVKILAKYREPNHLRSSFELAVSLGPLFLTWGLAWWALSYSYWLAAGLSVISAGFLLRVFAIQHDCGHASFFRNRQVSDWVGRALGVLTLTPYDVWRRSHSIHHSGSGNLDKRGIGDVMTLTVAEYYAMSRWGRLQYRLYRHPLVLFGLGPAYLFILQNRLPIGFMRDGWKVWTSAMGTNAVIIAGVALVIWLGGLMPILLIYLPTCLIAATLGVWLFYIQHQFEETEWQRGEDWQLHDAALHGSSHYDLPAVLRWMTANIGIHHVHHLYSRIPFYRLREVLRDYPALAEAQRMTLWQSFSCARMHLWDEQSQKLLSFASARQLRQAG
jgi:acyl-lipid omega-6 desaturase (Delta-12 desaturase)